HDSNVLDVIVPQPRAIYLIDKAYVDFEALNRIPTDNAFFVTRTKSPLKYKVIEQNFNIDQIAGLRKDSTIV
ncbi:MAG: transposase, partial [Sphingobacteriia bacterium]|nr:transposase [Sphingobacteriia bacterium]